MLSRRSFLAASAFAVAPAFNRGRFTLFPWSGAEYSARTIDLMKRATVIDMLSPITLNFPKMEQWLSKPASFTAADAAEFAASGISAFHIAVGMGGPGAYEDSYRYLALQNGFIASHPQWFARIDTAADFDRAKKSGRAGLLLGLQNSEHFRTAKDVEAFHALGQRVSQLTYNTRNMIGNGSTERRDEGLSDFGVSIVERMNAVGMAVDVSHCGDRTSLDAFEVSKKPVLITHSNARALASGHPRTKPDEVIKAMGKAGSVMGITGVRMFVKGSEPTTIESLLDHFDHVAKLTGPEHLGVGSDMDLHGYDALPPDQIKAIQAGYKAVYGFRAKTDIEGVDHPKRMFDLTEGLTRRKYTDAQIEGILGGNFKRVLGEIWGG
ncbi:MAG: membrane dipeptidase [Gemmatimonadetes bacterium]|nr:membrane dipeptidase [Gemmatimonadota bacterium]